MWIPQSLHIIDLMSIADSKYEFNQGKATVVVGYNQFDDDQDSNGSGKSAILEAISIAFRNKPLRDCSTKELVRRGTKCAKIRFELHNTFTQKSMVIDRTVYPNTKSSELTLTLDNIQQTLISVDHGKEMIFRELGISESDLINFYLLNKERYKPFLKMSESEKGGMISRFSQSNLVDPIFEEIESNISDIEREIFNNDSRAMQIESKIEVHYDEIVDLRIEMKSILTPKLAIDKEEQIANLKVREDKLNVELTEVYKNIEENTEKATNARKQYNELPTTVTIEKKLQTYREEYKDVKVERQEVQQDISNLQKVILKIEKTLIGLVQCPKCSHEFIANQDEDIDVEQSRKKKTKYSNSLKECEQEIEEIDKDIEKYEEKIEQLKETIEEYNAKKRQLDQSVNQLDREGLRLLNEKQEIKESIAKVKEQVKQLKAPVSDDGSLRIQQQKDAIQARIDKHFDSIKAHQCFKRLLSDVNQQLSEELGALFEEQSFFLQFKTHLSNKSIGALQAYANDYLIKTGSQFQIKLEGYKINRNKTVSEKITATILRNGDESVYGSMSSREKTRIILSLIVAPQMLINSTCMSGGLDLLFLDEIIESIDSKGISGCLRSLNCIDRTILLVTFGQFNEDYQYVLRVNKQPNGIAIFK